MGASTLVLVILFPINVITNVVLIHYTSFGLLGSPIALSITYWLSFIGLGLVTYLSPTHTRNGCWGGLKLRPVLQLRSCYTFLRLALPGILMVGTEWFVTRVRFLLRAYPCLLFRAAFEIVALAAGRLGSIPLAAQSVIMTTDQSWCIFKCPSHAILNFSPSSQHYSLRNRCGCFKPRGEPHRLPVGCRR